MRTVRLHEQPSNADQHAFFLVVDDGYVTLAVECPYTTRTEAAGFPPEDVGQRLEGADLNTHRPCWPHHADDEGEWVPDDAPQEICTYESWVDNCSIDEVLHGDLQIQIPAIFGWEDDYGRVEILEEES